MIYYIEVKAFFKNALTGIRGSKYYWYAYKPEKPKSGLLPAFLYVRCLGKIFKKYIKEKEVLAIYTKLLRVRVRPFKPEKTVVSFSPEQEIYKLGEGHRT